VQYVVIDTSVCSTLSWLGCDTLSTGTDGGGTTSITYDNAGSGSDLVAFTHPQTYNQGSGHPVHSWTTGTSPGSTSSTLHPCRHHGTEDDCDFGFATETYGIVVIDPSQETITGAQFNSHSLGESSYGSNSFSPSYTNPAIMVDQNSDSGPQDPQYVMYKNLATTGVDTRYCEQDQGDHCNSHNNEEVNTFSVEAGAITYE